MRGFPRITLCLGVALLAGRVAFGALPAVPGAGAYESVGKSRADRCTVALTLAPPEGRERFDAVDVALGIADGGDFLRFVWGADGFRAEELRGGVLTVRAEGAAPLPASLASGGMLTVKRHSRWLEVVAEDRRLFRVACSFSARGTVGTSPAAGSARVVDASVQKIEDTVFGDDFMRTADEAKELGLWEAATGEWRVHSVMEDIEANPDARIREGRTPDAGHSINPFSLSGRGASGAVILTGMPFWDDYEVAVSARSGGGQFGLIFGARDAENFHLVRWHLPSLGIRAGTLELVRLRDGRETVLGTAAVTGRIGNWYRLEARALGSRIEVKVDGVEVLAVRDDRSIGGRIGLYTRGDRPTVFDDVAMRTVTEFPLSVAESVAGHGGAVTGEWSVRGDDGRQEFVCAGMRGGLFGKTPESVYGFGFEDWEPGCLQATLVPDDGLRVAGVGLGFAGGGDRIDAVWTPRGGGEIRLRTVKGGDAEILAACPFRHETGQPLALSLDAREAGVVEVRANGDLVLREEIAGALSGRRALVASGAGNTVFRDVTAFSEPELDWEHPVNIEIFKDDPFMQGWASPRYAWSKRPGDKPGTGAGTTYVHNGDFYGGFRITLPVTPGMQLGFGSDDPVALQRYVVAADIDAAAGTGSVTLRRGGETVARGTFVPLERSVIPGQQVEDEKLGARPKTPDTVTFGSLEVIRDGRIIRALFEGKPVFSHRDDVPLAGRAVALTVSESIDLIHVGVVREKIKDYLFDRAAVDWVKVGSWEVTNRFACDPRWSHMNGRGMGVAGLWNKHEFDGDYTIEYFAGMRMRQGDMMEGAPRMYYPRVGDINVALSAVPRDIFSGYNMIFGAWDPMWTETESWFMRGGEVIERTTREFIPRQRHARAEARAIEVDWDPGGRPVHGAWYAIKIRKTGATYDVWFDNVPVFSVTDPEPLAGKRLALWTQHNSIVVARVKIGYREARKSDPKAVGANEPGPQAAVPAPAFRCVSHPGLFCDFENGADGVVPRSGDQSAELSRVTVADGHALRCTNLYGGGDFAVNLPAEGVDLARVEDLSLDFAAGPEARVNLYVRLADRPYERFFVTLTGPDHEAPNLTRLGRAGDIRDDGSRQRLRVPLGEMVRRALPVGTRRVVAEMCIGMLHEGYLNAGLGGNPEGAFYEIDDVVLAATGPADVVLEVPPGASGEFRAVRPGAEADGGWLAAQDGAVRLALDGPGDWLVESRVADGGGAIRRFALRTAAPADPVRTVPATDGLWGGGTVSVFFPAESPAHADGGDFSLTVAGTVVRLTDTMARYDSGERKLDVFRIPGLPEMADGEPVTFRLRYADTVAYGIEEAPAGTPEANAGEGVEAVPAPAAAETGAPQPVARQVAITPVFREYEWTARVSRAEDHTPPGRPVLDPSHGISLPFEESEAPAGASELDPTVSVIRVPREGTDGGHAVRVINRVCGGPSAVDLGLDPFTVGHLPLLSFDYRIDAHAKVDLQAVLTGGARTIGFTDREGGKTEVGTIPDVSADGTWHHAMVNLSALADGDAGGGKLSGRISKLAFGDWGYASNAPGASYELDNVMLSPITSSRDGLMLSWKAADLSGISGYSFVWDDQPATEPDEVPECAEGTFTFRAIPEGDARFHIRACDAAGNWGPTAHYRFVFDNTPPAVIAATPAPGSRAAAGTVRLRIEEAQSGVDTSDLSFTFDGSPLKVRRPVWDPEAGELVLNLLEDVKLFRGTIEDGRTLALSVVGLKDYAGNTVAPYSWKWTVDHGADHEPPAPPDLWSYSRSLTTYFDHFSDGPRYWQVSGGRGEPGTEITVVRDEQTGSDCLAIRKTTEKGRFGASRYRGSLNPDAYPLLAFDYRILPGTKVNLLLYVEKEWHAVRLTGGDGVRVIGEVPEAKDDGTWRRALIDLRTLLAGAFPDNPKPDYRLTALAGWDDDNPVGATVFIDNFAYVGEQSPLPLVHLSGSDPTGVAGYRLGFSTDPRGVPETFVPLADATQRRALSVADEAGLWFIHAQVQDGAGNWSEVLHCPYYCGSPAPPKGEDGLEADGEAWLANAWGRRSRSYVYPAETAGGNRLLGLQLLSGGKSGMGVVRPVDFTVQSPMITADVFNSTRYPMQVRALLRPQRGEPILGLEVEVPAGEWLRGGTFDFAADALADAGMAGAEPVPCREVGLMFYADKRARDVVLIDRFLVEGTGPALPQVQVPVRQDRELRKARARSSER